MTRAISSGTPVPRHQIFILADGSPVVQWVEGSVQDMLTDQFRPYYPQDFGHPVTDYELDRLIEAGRVERYTRQYVWVFALPEQERFSQLRTQEHTFNRMRAYYLNTTLPADQIDEVVAALFGGGVQDGFTVMTHNDLVVVMGRDGAPFALLEDAEAVQRRLLEAAPELLAPMVVAFVEATPAEFARMWAAHPEPAADEPLDLEMLIASQSSTDFAEGRSAMVVLGDPIERSVTVAVLERLKMRVVSAPTAQTALQSLELFNADLLIMELHLPDQHGWEMLNRVRELPNARGQRVVVFAEPTAADADRVFALKVAGVHVYLVKPVGEARLRQGIFTALKQQPTP